ncbi:Glucokinase [Acidibacillus sp. S0AB]|uniref:Glucokinase n=2 Tax=Sulfoacidibacillus ferrooxidans TaxID=2005001 RepID=A0A9X1V8Z6_9BACL|nr:Glucokinase [Sulfoacidibacillus ferrooxidans]
MGMRYGLVDIGGTKIQVAVSDGQRILKQITCKTQDLVQQQDNANQADDLRAHAIPNYIERTLTSLLHSTHQGEKINLCAVGVSVPGPIDHEGGIVRYASHLHWDNYPLADMLSKRLQGVPVYIEDDANCAGLGEMRFGAGQHSEHILYITISTGIGAALILHRKLYRGHLGAAGEIGHMTIEPDGHLCTCGNRGCLETIASGTAIAAQGNQLLAHDANHRLHQPLVGTHFLAQDSCDMANTHNLASTPFSRSRSVYTYTGLTASEVFDCAREGDPDCQLIVNKAGRSIGIALANIAHIISPETIILGGGVMKQSDYLLPIIIAEMESRLLAPFRNRIHIQTSHLADAAPLFGALTMILDRFSPTNP